MMMINCFCALREKCPSTEFFLARIQSECPKTPYLDSFHAVSEWLTDERRLRLIFSRDHCQRFSPSQVSKTLQAGFEPAQNLTSDFVK